MPRLTDEEREARQDPICKQFRAMSLKLSYAIRHRVTAKFNYNRDQHNTYGIQFKAKKGKTRYGIWFMHTVGIEWFVCIDRWVGSSGGLTTDPGLSSLATLDVNDDTVRCVLDVLKQHKVID